VGAALDIIEIDAASNTGVDNIRELIERAQYAPVQCRYKVYIIDECLTGDTLVLTDRGWMRIDDRTLADRQVLSYNELQQIWEWKKVLRWIDRGAKATLTIATTHRKISCTGNHLIGTDRGWIKAQELKPGMKILAPLLSPSNSKQKSLDRFAPADVVQNYLSPLTYSQVAVSIASNPIGKSTSMSKDMESGNGGKQNSLLMPQFSQSNSLGLFMAPCWETALLPTRINTADCLGWLGRTESVNRNGCHIKPVDCQNFDLSYKSSPMQGMAIDPVPVKLPVIPNYQQFLKLSNPQAKAKQSHSIGSDRSRWKDLHGGTSMMVPSASVLKEAPPSICTQKDIPLLKTNLLLTGLQSLATQQMLNPTKKARKVISITTLDLTPAPAVNGWQTCSPIPSHQWHTSLEMVKSVSPAGMEKVYDIEVEDNHNFVANGLLVHNCHMLTTAAFNSLLKTLEEPPAHVVFVLATTDPQRVLPTIISRCQRFDYRRIPVDAMVKHLTYIAGIEQIEIAPASVTLIAQIAQGGLRDAESLLDRLSLLDGEITPDRVYDAIGSVPERDLLGILQSIAKADPEHLIERTRAILERGKEPLTVLQNLAGCYRDLTIAKTAPKRPDLVPLTGETWVELCKIAQTWQLNWILAGQKHLKESETQLKQTTQPQLWLEIAILGLLNIGTQQSPAPTTTITPPAPQPISPPPPSAQPSPGEIAPAIAPAASNPPSAAIAAPTASRIDSNLVTTWEQVLQQLLPASRDLFKPFGKLIAISEAQAIVAMKSSTMQTIAAGKVPELSKVFSNMFGRAIVVKLEVMGKSQPQPSSIALPPPPAPTPTPPPAAPPQIVAAIPAPTPVAPPPLPAAGEYLTEDEDIEDLADDLLDVLPVSAIESPPHLPNPEPPPPIVLADPVLDIFEPPTDFDEPPDSLDIEQAASMLSIDSEDPAIDPALQAATDEIVKIFNGEIIDRHHELFDKIVGN
jgi:DNA polymerase III subunit gamma/tau